jgi:hypothetical protein
LRHIDRNARGKCELSEGVLDGQGPLLIGSTDLSSEKEKKHNKTN